MGLPAKKRTNRSKRDRASHFALKKVTVQVDAEGNAHLPHRASKAGLYRGKAVKTTKTAAPVAKITKRAPAKKKKAAK